jgi:GTP pyrophosphokinase
MTKTADKVFEHTTYTVYGALTIEAEKQIRLLFERMGLQPDISSRTKTIKSINEKIERKGYKNFEDEMYDISGVRIACMTRPQKEEVIKLLKERFTVIAHELGQEDPYRMGYSDEKLILCFGDTSEDYARLRGKRFEVQVRFLFMDAWAKFSHAFAYTDEKSIPTELLRKIQIMAAVCEMLDGLADAYAQGRDRFGDEIKEGFAHSTAKFANTPINLDSLQAYLEFKFPEKVVDRHIQSLIVRDIDPSKYKTIADIDDTLTRAKDFLDWWSGREPKLFTSGASYVTKALGWLDTDFRKCHPFGSQTRQAFGEFERIKRRSSGRL